MKIKGVNPIERHIEKIVLLIVGVVFLGVVAMQFLVNPNQIDVGGGNMANPGDELFAELDRKANALKGQIEDPNPSMPDVQQASLLDAYEEGMSAPASVDSTLAAWLDRPSGLDDLGGGSVEQLLATGAIQQLDVPAPTAPIAAAQWNTLDPFAASAWPGLGGVRSGNAPADFVGVSVEGVFPGPQLLEALTEVEEGRRPIPRKLWQRGGIAILDVQVERQRLTADGTWTAAQAITPAGPDAMAELSAEPDPEVVMTLVRAVVDEPGAILTPNYPPTISGDPWVPPTAAQERAARWANQAEADRIRATIARLEEEIGSGGRTTRSTTTTRDPGSGRNPGGTTRTSPTRTNRPNTDRQDEAKRRQIERLEERLAELGFGDEDDDPRTTRTVRRPATDPGRYVDPRTVDDPRSAPRSAPRRPAGRSDAPALLGAELPIWAHDLSARPGETYRYRLRAVVNNPLYGREALLDPDDPAQQALAKQAVVEGDWSEWTDPIEVPRRKYLFVRGVSEGGALRGQPRVTGEIFEMYYGYYRRSPFTLELGDAVASTAGLPETLVVIDPGVLAEADAERALDTLADWAADRDAETPPVRPELPVGLARAPESIELRYDAALVDIAESLTRERDAGLDTSSRAVMEAVFRLPDGSLMVREVGEDEGPMYALVDASAARGERDPLARVIPADQGLTGFVIMNTGLDNPSQGEPGGP
ncbi:MAG: hypothetical protein RIB60_06265 [Phycisphaerales bacterium]